MIKKKVAVVEDTHETVLGGPHFLKKDRLDNSDNL
jgi:hypothetical protein